MYSYVATFLSSFFPDEASQGKFRQIRPGMPRCGKSVHVRMPTCGYNMKDLRNKNKDKNGKSPKKRRKIFENKEFASYLSVFTK
jgi:hypothetical protein